MSTAIDLVALISSLNVAQLDALAHAIGQRKAQLQDAQLMREIVGDNRTNPNINAIPPSPTEWSHQRMAIWEETQRQRLAEREAARTQ